MLQRYWHDPGKPDGPIFTLPDTGPTFLILSHEDVKGGLWSLLWLAPLVLVPLAILRTFGLNHPWLPFLSYDNLLSFGRLGMR
jgi:hypothetical protein